MTDHPGPASVPAGSDPASFWHREDSAVFCDPASQALLAEIELVAPSPAPVLIHGETGTGKELIARQLHARSKRKGAFVAINCGAVAHSLAESEWFGHQAGSFTGANETRAGWFESADGGTLFLDEVADLPLPMQVKLLRVLQESEVVRVGARKAIPLDIRIVAATNVDLGEAVAEGRFRPDLYYRLNVLTLHVPALRERPADMQLLIDRFVRSHSARMQRTPPVLSPEAAVTLYAHSWPGNIRELENVIHFSVLVSRDGVITPQDLRLSTRPNVAGRMAHPPSPLDAIRAQLDRLFADPPAELYQTLEALIVKRAFGYCGANQVHTAKLLGVSRSVVRTLLKRLGLVDELDVAPTNGEALPQSMN